MEANNLNDEDLKKEAPLLFGKEKANPFKVDDAYFEKLSAAIQDKISAEKSIPVWQKLLQGFLSPRIAIPVVVCLIIAIIFIVKTNQNQTEIANNMESISIEDLSNSDYLYQIDEQLIADAMPVSAAEQNTVDIENYLIENNINVNELTDQLNTTSK